MAANSRFSMAIHIISLLAAHRETSHTSSWLASTIHTNPVVVRRILSGLSKSGIVGASEGKAGGFRLLKCPDDVTLWDIYRALGQEHLFAVHANPVDKSCAVSAGVKDILGAAFGKAEAAAQAELKKINVASILKKSPRE